MSRFLYSCITNFGSIESQNLRLEDSACVASPMFDGQTIKLIIKHYSTIGTRFVSVFSTVKFEQFVLKERTSEKYCLLTTFDELEELDGQFESEEVCNDKSCANQFNKIKIWLRMNAKFDYKDLESINDVVYSTIIDIDSNKLADVIDALNKAEIDYIFCVARGVDVNRILIRDNNPKFVAFCVENVEGEKACLN